MTRRPAVARLRQARSVRPIRRRSARPSPVRAAAALVALGSGAVLYGLVASPIFGFERLVVDGARFTSRADIETALGLQRGESVFGLAVDRLEARLAALPAVERAAVAVRLPDTVAVDLVERRPILAWRTAGATYLVDADGVLLARIADPGAGAAVAPAGGSAVPLVDDRRAGGAGLRLGGTLSGVDLDAARRLGSLRPADVGSAAPGLVVAVDDADGWTLRPLEARTGAGTDGTTSGAPAWTAVFGFYTPTLRPTTMIPGQVRLLRSLLRDREPTVARVVLASETDGTFVPRPSPSPEEGRGAP